MARARILILTNGPLARNPRVGKEAAALAADGNDVTVLGVRNHRPSVPLDAEIVAESGCYRHQQVEMLEGPTAWLRRAWLRIARDMAARGGPASIHALGPAVPLLRAARAVPSDLVIAHNEIAHWAALRLRREGRRIAADIEDWHSEDLLPAQRASRPLALLRRMEHDLLHQAAYTTTTSEALAAELHSRYGGQRPSVVTNSFPLPPSHRAKTVDGGAPVSFFWFSQTTGPGRGLEPFMAAWARTTVPTRVVLLGEITGRFDRELVAGLDAAHRERVEFLPLVCPTKLPACVGRHDLGLALEQANIASRNLTITNKILQYLGGGLAVVATATAGQHEVLDRSPDAGVFVDLADPAAAAATFDGLAADRRALRRRQAAARALAATWYDWEKEAPRLAQLVRHALR